MKYGNRISFRRVMSSPVTLLGGFILCALLARAAIAIHQKAVISEQRLAETQAEYDRLQDHAASLDQEVARLSTDTGIEAELRTRYHAVKDGESVAVILGSDGQSDQDQTADAADAASSTNAGGDSSWFWSMLHWFGL
ncbi:MAG: septum formation initiator family protein [Patescibacteria group bacterium]|nr:septum formation initiator family protein [Patescibacteria group bacterium]MDE2172355.1 septum formation initiator family protein [Patescibacteria group bacterium]